LSQNAQHVHRRKCPRTPGGGESRRDGAAHAERSLLVARDHHRSAREGRAGGPGGRCYGARVLGDLVSPGLREIGRSGAS